MKKVYCINVNGIRRSQWTEDYLEARKEFDAWEKTYVSCPMRTGHNVIAAYVNDEIILVELVSETISA